MEKLIFEAYPGGNYVAGTPSGCWWNIYLPFEEMTGGTHMFLENAQKTYPTLEIKEAPYFIFLTQKILNLEQIKKVMLVRLLKRN